MLSRFTSKTLASARSLTARSFATYFSKDHEWIEYTAGKPAVVGITDYAQHSLGDIVYVELPEVGSTIKAGDSFSSVESVKAASDAFCPATGKVLEVNTALSETPSIVNESPMEKGWFMKLELSNPDELKELMDKAAYDKVNIGIEKWLIRYRERS